MQNELGKLSVKSEIKLNTDPKKTWELFKKPCHLELFHSFCKCNETIIWNEQKKIDELTYLNGLVYERNIYSCNKNKGFKLYIGKKKLKNLKSNGN